MFEEQVKFRTVKFPNAARTFVETHPDVLQELENKIHDLYFGEAETVSE